MNTAAAYVQINYSHRTTIVNALREVVPEHCILYEEEDTRPYECDGLSLFRQLPMIVCLPEDESQVLAIVRMCRKKNTPIVARGAGTGLSGGAQPHPAGVLLCLSKMNRIIKIDPLARTAVLQPGVRNLAISEAAAPYNLYYAPDPSSQIACSIGGNVAENSGGIHCLKYGLTLHNVLKVRALNTDGEVVEFGSDALDNSGLDLLSLVIGSEGMLVVITEVTVKLLPKPQHTQVIMASFNDVEVAGQAVTAVIAAGIIPAGLEMMDQQASRMVEPFVQAGYDTEAKAILLLESDGTAQEVTEEIQTMSAVLEQIGATQIKISQSEEERIKFWAGRKNAFPAAGRISPDYYCMDGTIPRKRLGQVLKAIANMEKKYQLRCANVFHAGDGNLHPLILFDASNPKEVTRAEAFGAAILELCVEVGGTITGEHGIGIEKIAQMCVQFSRLELDCFFAIKRSFDPHILLNTGKAIPTMARCAEHGRIHVHGGKLPFAHLPRF